MVRPSFVFLFVSCPFVFRVHRLTPRFRHPSAHTLRSPVAHRDAASDRLARHRSRSPATGGTRRLCPLPAVPIPGLGLPGCGPHPTLTGGGSDRNAPGPHPLAAAIDALAAISRQAPRKDAKGKVRRTTVSDVRRTMKNTATDKESQSQQSKPLGHGWRAPPTSNAIGRSRYRWRREACVIRRAPCSDRRWRFRTWCRRRRGRRRTAGRCRTDARC